MRAIEAQHAAFTFKRVNSALEISERIARDCAIFGRGFIEARDCLCQSFKHLLDVGDLAQNDLLDKLCGIRGADRCGGRLSRFGFSRDRLQQILQCNEARKIARVSEDDCLGGLINGMAKTHGAVVSGSS